MVPNACDVRPCVDRKNPQMSRWRSDFHEGEKKTKKKGGGGGKVRREVWTQMQKREGEENTDESSADLSEAEIIPR